MSGTTVVVGGAQGIGAAVAEHLINEPWTDRIVIADIRHDLVEEMAERMRTEGKDAVGLSVDVSDPASIDTLVAASSEAEQVAIVAGIFKAVPSLETTWDDFDKILSVNLMGNFFVAQAYAKHMVERRSGAIVAIASIAARMGRMRQAAYCASKAGMRQALRVLAMETVPLGVRINTVSPGPADTPMMRTLAADHGSVDDLAIGSPEAFRPRVPDGRVAPPRAVAAAVAYLLSPAADHVAFHDLYVDGGETIGM
jgi:2,3-dihydro-2,3-dihydroxybenzoate dehydrogenase